MPLKLNNSSGSDRIWPALVMALVLHGAVLALVELDLPRLTEAPELDVVWVATPAPSALPDQPDFLANVSQQAATESDVTERPADEGIPQAPAASTDSPVDNAPMGRGLDLGGLSQLSGTVGWSEPQSLASPNPRHKYINAATQEHRFAAYMDAWIQKVERVGRVHYPQQARRRGLSGDLVLSVDLLPSGEVAEIRIERGSGHAVLDQAAHEIVSMAAPYAPLPIEPGELDRLTITRTWQFSSGGTFR